MYPIDITGLARRGTLGARAGDPTLPEKPRRRSRLARGLRLFAKGAPATKHEQASSPRCRAQFDAR